MYGSSFCQLVCPARVQCCCKDAESGGARDRWAKERHVRAGNGMVAAGRDRVDWQLVGNDILVSVQRSMEEDKHQKVDR